MTEIDLAEFRARMAGCELVMFADIATQTILASDCAIKLGQEHLDHLCSKARAVFGIDACASITSVYLERPTGKTVIVRRDGNGSEVLCSVFGPTTDLSGVVEMAGKLLSTVESQDGLAQ